MSATPLCIRHVDLSAPEAEEPCARDVFAVFWWKDLFLGVRLYHRLEWPLEPYQLAETGADLIGAVLAARSPALAGRATLLPDGRSIVEADPGAAAALADPGAELDRLAAPSRASAADMSVIVCTRHRPEALARCLQALTAQQARPLEILVVDNTEGDAATLQAVSGFGERVRYLIEPTPGLSAARNAGVRAARGERIAFTDDDVIVTPNWTAELSRVLDETGAEAVNGLVLPVRLDTPAQRLFQVELNCFEANPLPMTFDRAWVEAHTRQAAPVWRLGAGANMAFTRRAFERSGLFDERLGAGRSGCSEDSEMWRRIIEDGGRVAYDPRAVVLHEHRETLKELYGQTRAYTRGHVSALFVQHRAYRRWGDAKRIWLSLPRYFARLGVTALKFDQPARYRLAREELIGWLEGLAWLARDRTPITPELPPRESSRLTPEVNAQETTFRAA